MPAIASNARSLLYVSPKRQVVFRELGLDAERIFDWADIRGWRTLPDRENCTLAAELPSGERVRWHIKRYAPVAGATPAETEVAGIRLLETANIPTVDLVGYGKLADGRSFLILDDLAGYIAGDKWLEKGNNIESFVDSVAELTARLHQANLHHRDLYFCHFMLRYGPRDLRMIDAARVRKLPRGPARLRWIVKDLAQLWYSLPANSPRQKLMDRYVELMGWSAWKRKLVQVWMEAKSRSIGRHDARLRVKQPRRNISLPEINSEPPAG